MLERLTFSLTSLILTASPLSCASSQLPAQQESACVILRVADGDSFTCRGGQRVRLIGIDSPEQQQRPHGARARQALLGLMPPGTVVRLEHDVAPVDRYGRLLAHAWVDTTLINEAMVRGGWAVLYTVPPNVKYADRLSQAQKEARARGTGLWIDGGFECLPADFRRRKCLSPP